MTARWMAFLLAAGSCLGATSGDLAALYGSPVMQQFHVRKGAVLSVEYGADGRARSVRIRPEGYQQDSPKPDLVMDSQAVSDIIDWFVPPSIQHGMAEIYLGAMVEMTDGATTIHRVRAIRENDQRPDREATIDRKSGLFASAVDVQARFGPPVSERFVAEPGVALTATYNASGVASEIKVTAVEPAPSISSLTADLIVNEVAPAWSRTGKPQLAMMMSGMVGLRIEEFDDVTITRSFQGDAITQAAVTWGPSRVFKQ